jgi:hypothetical protein
MDSPFDQALDADLSKLELPLITALRAIVAECKARRPDIRKGLLLVEMRVECDQLGSGFPVRLTLLDAEMTPLEEPRVLLADSGPTFPAARLDSEEKRARAAERLRTWLSERWDAAGGHNAADLVTIEDSFGVLNLERGSWSFQTWDEVP